MAIFTIIQARLNSTRLPRKVLLPFKDNKNVLEFLIERLIELNPIIATVKDADEIVNIAKKYNLRYFIGSEEDVLERFFLTTKYFNAKENDLIVRICSDSPFLNSKIVKEVIKNFKDDYTHNLNDTKGLNVEVFRFKCLEKAYFNAKTKFEKEHVTPWIKNNCKINEVNIVNLDKILTLDTKEDYEYLKGNLDKNKSLEIRKTFLDLVTPQDEGSGLKWQSCNNVIPQKKQNVKSILFDLDMPKWVLFFLPIIKRLKEKNLNVVITSRGGEDYSELNKVLDLYNLDYISIGEYGGASLEGKLKASIYRQTKLIEVIKKYNVQVVVSGSVVDINRVAFGLGVKVINFNDMPIRGYKNECKNVTAVTRLTAPFSTTLFKPFVVPSEIFKNLGVCNIKEYNFLDPLIWLKDFVPDIDYIKKEIPKIDFNKKIIVVREEEFKASYVQNKYSYFYEVIEELQKQDINLIIIPRYDATHLKERFKKAIVLEKKIILQHLLAYSDLFIGGGGTINIEATYFGVPVISTRSFISHYDKFLIDNNLMWHSNKKDEILDLVNKLLGKKTIEKAKEIYGKMEVDIDMFVDEIMKELDGY